MNTNNANEKAKTKVKTKAIVIANTIAMSREGTKYFTR
jgi:sugar lactone lactonase YvrE